MENKEFTYKGLTINGFLAILLILAVIAGAVYCFILADKNATMAIPGMVLILLLSLGMNGFIKLEPNEAKVLVFFGKYSGTFFKNGFYWVNPLLSKKSVTS